MTPTNATATPTTATSEAPVGRCTGRGGRRSSDGRVGRLASGRFRGRGRLHDSSVGSRADIGLTAKRSAAGHRPGGCQDHVSAPAHDPNMDVAARDPRSVRRDVIAIFAGLAVLALGMLAVRDGAVSDVEEASFRAVNDLPGWLYPLVWPFQQLGALVLGPVVALVALLLRRYRLAIAACIVTLLKLLSERAVKAAVSRERPGTSIGSDIELRGDVHAERRELRVRARRARRRPRRRRHAVPARTLEDRALGPRRRGHGRARVRRRTQHARCHLWRRARHRHRRGREPGDHRPARPGRRAGATPLLPATVEAA